MADKPTPPPQRKPGQNDRAYGAMRKRWYNKLTPDGKKQGEVWDKHMGELKAGTKSRSTLTPDQQAQSAAARAKNAGKPGYDKDGNPLDESEKLRIKKKEDRIDDDWQTNPDFDREQGGWAPDPSQGVAGDAFTVWDALSIKGSALRGVGSLLIRKPLRQKIQSLIGI